ncbi:MAG: hypothetical protein GXP45_05075 [bacterium]|nr:hypothetical protein [bacterium]
MNTSGLNMGLSMIKRHLEIRNGRFADWDTRLTWQKIARDISREDLSAHKGLLVYTAKTFFSYFENISIRSFFRALATAKTLKAQGRSKEAEDILEYMIKGQLINRFGKIPDELNSALSSFKQFFFVNLQNFDTKIANKIKGTDAEKGIEQAYRYANMSEYRLLKKTINLNRNDPDFYKKQEWDNSQYYINPLLLEIENSLRRKNLE